MTEREREILLLKKKRGFSDYRIGCLLHVDPDNVGRSRRNVMRKLELARADLRFLEDLEEE